MSKKKGLMIYPDDLERQLLENIAKQWGCSLSAAAKRLIREGAIKHRVKVVFKAPSSEPDRVNTPSEDSK